LCYNNRSIHAIAIFVIAWYNITYLSITSNYMGERHGDYVYATGATEEYMNKTTNKPSSGSDMYPDRDRIAAELLGGVSVTELQPEEAHSIMNTTQGPDEATLRALEGELEAGDKYYEVFEESLRLKNVLMRLRELMLDPVRTSEERQRILTRVNAVSEELDKLEVELKSLKS
jgi:hypothetical protein